MQKNREERELKRLEKRKAIQRERGQRETRDQKVGGGLQSHKLAN